MKTKEVRILEACHKFLIGITQFEKELQDDCLVYQYHGKNIVFNTYQVYENLSFTDYIPKYNYLDDKRTYLDNKQDLIKAFPSKEVLRILQRIENPEQTRIQIFKLLSEVTLEPLTEQYPNVKEDNFGYNFFNLVTKERYPIYLFSENANFELVAITQKDALQN
ncbi:hypothetical protein [Streptococcus sp. sy004]|uniref:hypothetical protein n=1 Tax=Streptococcus sp. sy004 TaxID=2600149 RepID=UPI0011B42A7A|nr:hypothetical protein [Streptococcus sp. sy004]TWT12050.1 hypothetical protein FRX54_00505 [Streptococcus sp. sy004]